MSQDPGAVPAPLVLDISVITAVVRGDAEVTNLILGYDADGQPLIMPVLAIAAASLDSRTAEARAVLGGLERLENVSTAPLLDAEQAHRLAAVIAATGLDPWDAHAAMTADTLFSFILTLDGGKWQEHARDLDEQLHFIEIADPDDG